jgi:hypothetical protein
MQEAAIGKTTLSPLSSGSCFSYELCGNKIVVRFLGIVPVQEIRMAEILHLRLASRAETAPLVFLLNWLTFYFCRPAYNPIYLLKTRKGKCYFMKLTTDSHRKLRQAIGRDRHPCRRTEKKAA